MEDIFIKILNMSITASYFVIALIILRAIFRKIPKWLNCALWGLVGLRLILPFSFESILSLIPSSETIPPDITMSKNPQISSGIPVFNHVINPVISESLTPDPSYSVNPLQVITFVLSVLWVTGIAAMLTYTLVSYILLRRKTRESIKTEDGTYICDTIGTPFILGIIKPKIFIPSLVTEADKQHIIAHEKAHIKRLDHLWKPLGFLILSVYWFNPLMWVAYIFLCRDIEAACDEKVLKNGGAEIKKSYSEALINCSAPKRLVTACPLAFGETGVKGRIKNVLNYKKPTLWIIIFALIVSIILSACFMTNPMGTRINDIPEYENIFKNVEKLQFFTGENTVYTTEDPTFELRHLKKVKINPEPLELYPGYYYKIEINDRFEIHISTNFEFLHLRDKSHENSEIVADNGIVSYDNWIAPSAVYRIEDAGKIKDFFLKAPGRIEILNEDDSAAPLTTYDGVYITLDSVETEMNDTVSFNLTWHNETDKIISFGENFNVQYDDGTGYVEIRPKDTVFAATANLLYPDSEIQHTHSMHGLDISRNGTYRITTFFWISEDNPVEGGYYDTQTIFSVKNEGSTFRQDGQTTIVKATQLTLNDILRLSEKGDDLTWSDFDGFSYIEPYISRDEEHIIRSYKIDDKFSVAIIGNPKEKPHSIFLNAPATGGAGNSYDVRKGNLAEWIKENSSYPKTVSLSFSQKSFRIDNTGNNYNAFVDYGCYRIPVWDHLQYLPVIRIETKEELLKLRDYFNEKRIFDEAFKDEAASFNEMCELYDTLYTDFFNNFSLFITYCTTSKPENIPNIGYANAFEGRLTLCINEMINESDGNELLTGWISVAEIRKSDLSEINYVEAFLYGAIPYPYDADKILLGTYTYIESAEQVIKPYFNLYDDQTFMMVFHPFSDYIGYGTYIIDGVDLILTANDGQVYKFRVDDFQNYEFDEEATTGGLYMSDIVHKAVFYKTR